MTVDVVVLGKHVDVSAAVRDHTVTKLQRVEKFAPDVRRVDVDYSAPHNRSQPSAQCEILVHLKKLLVKGHATSADQRSALDLAFTRVERQLRRLHARRTDRRNGHTHAHGNHADNNANGNGAAPNAAPSAANDDVIEFASDTDEAGDMPGSVRVVKAKQFEVKPMVVEEAALQMELLGHDFFLFTSAESGRAAVIYRRRDGSFGLIEATG
jgi:ribosome hibernation promoting factor